MKIKSLTCSHGHLLGEIRWNGNGVPQIMVYRDAVLPGVELPHEMIGPFTGQADVQCSICKDVRTWGVTVEVMLYLVEAMPTKMLFNFWLKLLQRAKSKEAKHVKVDG